MARNFTVFLFALVALVSFSGCAGSGNEPNREIVDQQYVDSETYHSFSSQANQEQENARNQKNGMSAQLKSLTDCSASQSLNAPFTIDSLKIMEWNDSDGNNCFNKQSFEKSPYTLKVLAQTSFNDVKILWILRSRISMYQDQELFIATYEDEELHSAESIGAYRENLKEKISTDIEVSPKNRQLVIAAVENRDIKYPIEQNNSIENIYYVTSRGGIKK